jgi:hypothetical protein
MKVITIYSMGLTFCTSSEIWHPVYVSIYHLVSPGRVPKNEGKVGGGTVAAGRGNGCCRRLRPERGATRTDSVAALATPLG